MNILEQQKKLNLSIINYDLNKTWQTHVLINTLREKIAPLLPDGTYDRQDLEHQVLFRLTTFEPCKINDELIKKIIDEQFSLLQFRLKKLEEQGFDLTYLFRGLTGKHQDLNIHERLVLCHESGKLIARNVHRSFNVEFKIITDEKIISLFTSELHYIHKNRPKGETFGFYFSGDTIPWAVETTEPSIIAKKYKRDALIAHGIDPNKAIELTRFYTLPGAPINAISLMDGLVGKYYKEKGIEALFTTTMPMYSKTKGTTIAGGINNVLLIKDLSHKFVPEEINGKKVYRHVTSIPDSCDKSEILSTHPTFPTMHVVEVFKRLDNKDSKALDIIRDGKKVMYIKNKMKTLEQETKFMVEDINQTITNLKKISTYHSTEYIRDVIWGASTDSRKIRLRISNNFDMPVIEAIYKHKIDDANGIKNEIEEIIYQGPSVQDAIASIKKEGEFKEENSYEKMRAHYKTENTNICVDVYPYGTWLEIEGEEENIWQIAAKLGYKKHHAITLNADELYLEWIKKNNLKEMWDVRFGLTGKK